MQVLADLGFETLAFEDYSPLEQAQIVNGVDVLVSQHGAGFANMLYAKANATMVELSTLQVARHRFGDFHMHAAASGARHVHFFCDHDFDDAGRVPNVHADGLRGVSLSDTAINRLDGYLKTLVLRRAFLRFKQKIEKLAEAVDYPGIIAAVTEDPRFLYSLADIPLAAAQAHEALGDHTRAADHYRIALDVSPFRTRLRPRHIEALLRAGDTDGARTALDTFRIMAPYWYDRYTTRAGGVDGVLAGATLTMQTEETDR